MPSESQNLGDTSSKFSVISLSLDGSDSAQYFEQGEPYVTSLNFIVGKSTVFDGIVLGAEFMQFL